MNNIINFDPQIDLYQQLEINSNSSDEEIKRAWKKLALKYHPDKNNNISGEKFIKIKYAYDILSNKNLKKQYDDKLKFKIKIGDGINIFNFNFNLKESLSNFFDSTETNKIIKLILKKKEVYNKLFDFPNIHNNFLYDNLNDFIKKLIDIKIIVDFDLKDIWECNPKLIKYERCTKSIFEELIYPIDFKQIYENEGDEIFINNVLYKGNLIVEINIINTSWNEENYYIIDDELYILIDNKRIIDGLFYINFLDGNKYKFNIKKLKKIKKKIGTVYYKKKIGLPKFFHNDITDKNENLTICIEDIESNIIYSNLFFIIL
jgi:curved DNA-binding protein CbpA